MSVGRDSTYNLVAALSPALFTLVVTPFYLQIIGPERYGILAICWTIVGALGFTSLGMGPALSYRVAQMDRAPSDAMSRMFWTAIDLALGASLLGALFVVAVGQIYFGRFFHGAARVDLEIWRALPLLSLMLPLGVLAGVLNGALQGMRRFGTLSAIAVLNAALVSITPLAAGYQVGVQLSVLILSIVVASTVVLIVQFVVCGTLTNLAASPTFSSDDAKTLLGYGGWMSATALVAPLVMLVDRFLIGALRGPVAVAAYVLPYSLVQQLIFLPASLSSAILPRIAALPSEDEVRVLQSKSLNWLNGLLTPLTVVAIALAAPFFRVWVGPNIGSIASPVAAILLVGGWVHGIGHIPSTVAVARNRPDLLTKLLLAYLVPYLALLYFAIRHFGIVGAATAWTIRAAFDPVLFLYIHPRRSDLLAVVLSGALVLAAMATALVLSWASLPYWLAMLLLIAAATYQSRAILIPWLDRFRELDLSAN